MHLDVQDGIVVVGLLAAVAAMLAVAPTLRIPFETPLTVVVAGRSVSTSGGTNKWPALLFSTQVKAPPPSSLRVVAFNRSEARKCRSIW